MHTKQLALAPICRKWYWSIGLTHEGKYSRVRRVCVEDDACSADKHSRAALNNDWRWWTDCNDEEEQGWR